MNLYDATISTDNRCDQCFCSVLGQNTAAKMAMDCRNSGFASVLHSHRESRWQMEKEISSCGSDLPMPFRDGTVPCYSDHNIPVPASTSQKMVQPCFGMAQQCTCQYLSGLSNLDLLWLKVNQDLNNSFLPKPSELRLTKAVG